MLFYKNIIAEEFIPIYTVLLSIQLLVGVTSLTINVTSLTLRHCNTLSSINNSPTRKATLPNVPTLTSYTLLTSE